jgi:hypothetical protein
MLGIPPVHRLEEFEKKIGGSRDADPGVRAFYQVAYVFVDDDKVLGYHVCLYSNL